MAVFLDGDVFIAGYHSGVDSLLIEQFRSGALIDTIDPGVAGSYPGQSMDLDSAKNLYIPAYFGDGVVKVTPDGVSQGIWWSSVGYGGPWSVSTDESDNIYVLANGTPVKVIKLNTSATILATYTLAFPAAYTSGFCYGGSVSPDGTKYLYSLVDDLGGGLFGEDSIIAQWDLVNDLQLPDFTTENWTTFIPGGLRVRSGDGKVFVALADPTAFYFNGTPSPGPSVSLRVYEQDASSYVAFVSAPSAAFDVALQSQSTAIFTITHSGKAFRASLSTGLASDFADFSGRGTVAIAILPAFPGLIRYSPAAAELWFKTTFP